jgi:hypothetical protein
VSMDNRKILGGVFLWTVVLPLSYAALGLQSAALFIDQVCGDAATAIIQWVEGE